MTFFFQPPVKIGFFFDIGLVSSSSSDSYILLCLELVPLLFAGAVLAEPFFLLFLAFFSWSDSDSEEISLT